MDMSTHLILNMQTHMQDLFMMRIKATIEKEMKLKLHVLHVLWTLAAVPVSKT